MKVRDYIWLKLGTAAAILAVVSGVNWIIDPLAIYGAPLIVGLNSAKPAIDTRARIFKTVNVLRGHWDALIVGTSRADQGLDPQHQFFFGMRCFNAGTSGQPYEESFRLVEAASRRGTLKRVVWGLDFEVANAYADFPGDFVDENFEARRPLQLALSVDEFAQSVMTPFRQDGPRVFRHRGEWLPDGRLVAPSPNSPRRAALDSEELFLVNYFPAPERMFEFTNSRRSSMARVRDLIALAHSRRIELFMLISPLHARQLETIAVAGLWPKWEEWQRLLVAINDEEARKARRDPFPLWDFSGYNSITTEPFPALEQSDVRMRWYRESSHYSVATGNLVLLRMMRTGNADTELPRDFGVPIAPNSIGRHLAQLRDARAVWLLGHVEEAQEIKSLQEGQLKGSQNADTLSSRVK